MAVVIVLHPDQADNVAQIAGDLELPVDLVVQMLLSGPLSRQLDHEFTR